MQMLPQETESLGVRVLESRGVFAEAKWYWIGFAATVGYIFVFNALFSVALTYLNREYILLHSQT